MNDKCTEHLRGTLRRKVAPRFTRRVGTQMMKLKWIFWVTTFTLTLVFSSVIVFSPPVGRYPAYFAIMQIVLAPVFLVPKFVGEHQLWSFSEKSHWPVAIVIGISIALTSMAYAGMVTGVIALVKRKGHYAQQRQAG